MMLKRKIATAIASTLISFLVPLWVYGSAKTSMQKRKESNHVEASYLKEEKPPADLLTVYHLALNNDMTLAAAKATYKADIEDLPIARSALLPQIGLTASTAWNKQVNRLSDAENQEKNEGAPRTFFWNTHQWGASLTQPVFDASSWFDFKAAQQQNVQSLATFNLAQQNLIMRVATSYFSVLRLEDGLATTLAEQRAVKQQVTQAEERFRVGLLPRADVEEAKASYDAVAVQVIEDKNQVDLAYKELATITGKPVNQLAHLGVKLSLNKPEPSQSSAWVNQAIHKNLALQAVKAGVNVSRYQLKSAKAERLPTISAAVNYTSARANTTRQLNRADNTVYSLDLSVPIFTSGLNASTIAQNKFKLESAQYQEELETRTVTQDTLSYFASVNADLAKVHAACQGIVSAGVALKVTESGYRAGIRTILDVLQSQQNLFTAQQSYLNSRYSYIINTLNLKLSAGILSPADLVALNELLDHKTSSVETTDLLTTCTAITKQ